MDQGNSGGQDSSKMKFWNKFTSKKDKNGTEMKEDLIEEDENGVP